MASALVVIDRTTGGLCTWNISRGPLWRFQIPDSRFQESPKLQILNDLLETILEDARRDRCLTLYLSPAQPLPPTTYNLQPSPRQEQPEATRILDLTQSENEILAQMHPKGRYNIHVAQKNGVVVEESRDTDAFYSLLKQTAERDGFQILPLKAYEAFLERLPGSFFLMAYGAVSGEPIAGLLGVMWGQIGVYYYGASSYTHRALMAPYALQWEAMRLCKTKGCTTYDLLGIAPPRVMVSPSNHDTGNAPFRPLDELRVTRGAQYHHPWAGVSAFKEKFGGTVITYPPEQQIVLRPWLWKILQWKRWIVG